MGMVKSKEASASVSNDRCVLKILTLLFVFYLCSFLKMHTYFFYGRFWAEEGTLVFPRIFTLPWYKAMVFLFHGHLELVSNLVVFVAACVPIEYAPLVTTHASLAVQFVPILLLFLTRENLGITFTDVLIITVIYTGLPSCEEVRANTTNMHFTFMAIMAFLLILPEQSGIRKIFVYAGVLICGLCGMTPNLLLFPFIAIAYKSGKREHLYRACIVAFTCLLQTLLIVTHSDTAGSVRSFSVIPRIQVAALFIQQLLVPALSRGVVHRIISFLRQVRNNSLIGLIELVLYSTVILVLYGCLISQKSKKAALFGALAMFLFILSTSFSLQPDDGLISAMCGGRYFFVPNFLFYISLCSVVREKQKIPVLRYFFIMVFITSLICMVPHARTDCVPWKTALADYKSKKSGVIKIWPKGWVMSLPKAR